MERTIPEKVVIERIHHENTWWSDEANIANSLAKMNPREYLELLFPLIEDFALRRAVVVMGPRRVGKTVLLHHVIQRLLAGGILPQKISYVSVDQPPYTGRSLEEMFVLCQKASAAESSEGGYFFFDEVQYISNWEQQLKVLVDMYPQSKFVVSGSAAAALKMKSDESGAGRFTDFILPPLTFREFVTMRGELEIPNHSKNFGSSEYIRQLNQHFVDYINYGGYPEAVMNEAIRQDPSRFIRSDIIDKVLLRDLPSLYGISDIQELSQVFQMMAYNTGKEFSLSKTSKDTRIARNTLEKYLEYFEAAFLLHRVHRIDQDARRYKRDTQRKYYLTNPSMFTALFGLVTEQTEGFGHLVETAFFAQWLHISLSRAPLFYYRTKREEIDFVLCGAQYKPSMVAEIKWSDQEYSYKPLWQFCRKHKLTNCQMTSVSLFKEEFREGVCITRIPTSVYCLILDLMRDASNSSE